MSIDNGTNTNKLNILFLYCARSTFTNTVMEYLEAFKTYSQHNIFYLHATDGIPTNIDLDHFDAVMLHYSVRMFIEYKSVTPSYVSALKRFNGYKILFIQDEYDLTNVSIERIKSLGIHTVFTCVPQAFIEKVYPKEKLPGVVFISILTGYVSETLLKKLPHVPSIHNRKLYIAYRGRALPFWYGQLGQEKEEIGKKMREYCDARKIPVDIEWSDGKRIYGDGWYDFLGSAKATLGTESGSNLFDFNGDVRKLVERELNKNTQLTFPEIYNKHLNKFDNYIEMNQISPKIFEAIALKTALILFEGNYSGIIQPNVHYISLKKDFSNIEEVFKKLSDDNFLEKMVERAYQDILLSKKYSYKNFIRLVDNHIDQNKKKSVTPQSLTTVLLPNTVYSIPDKKCYYSLLNFPSTRIHNLKDNCLDLLISSQFKQQQTLLRSKRLYSVSFKFFSLLRQKMPRFANFLLYTLRRPYGLIFTKRSI